MRKSVVVRLPVGASRAYSATIENGIVRKLQILLAKRAKHFFIITDTNVRRLYGSALLQELIASGANGRLLDFPAGEQSKNFKTVHALQTALLENGIRRDSLIIALGGGVVGDVAGFVAATILRGVKYVQVPTTLLAQADSGVGGKVGIDHPLGKNLIGAFHHPAGVFIDPGVLRTLSPGEFRNGLAEVVKIAAALDKKFFSYLEERVDSIAHENTALLSEILHRSVGLKAAVVENDEFESDLRKTLNVGHTIGHALEAATNYTLKHGEAVSIGIAAESRIALHLGLLPEREYKRIVNVLEHLKLPTKFPSLKTKARFFSALSADKKFEGNATRFSLLAGIGCTALGVAVPNALIEHTFFASYHSSHRSIQ